MAKTTARAKINLHLHVSGRRPDDGYHLVDSLVCFADIGDDISLNPSDDFDLLVDGPFANFVPVLDNSLVKAVRFLEKKSGRRADVGIALTKNLPAGAGLGGGTADAAATIRALCELWGIAVDALDAGELARLGADVPACLRSEACLVRGIGETLLPAPSFPSLPAVLIWPRVHASTAEIFKSLETEVFSQDAVFETSYAGIDAFVADLKKTRNDLTAPACRACPVIRDALHILEDREDCFLARMSGSGSSVFGIFGTDGSAAQAAAEILRAKPGWWVKPVLLN